MVGITRSKVVDLIELDGPDVYSLTSLQSSWHTFMKKAAGEYGPLNTLNPSHTEGRLLPMGFGWFWLISLFFQGVF